MIVFRFVTLLITFVLIGYGVMVTALAVGENHILLHPGTDERGKQFYVNRLQTYCDRLECHHIKSGALCFELEKTNSDPKIKKRSLLLCHGNAGTALDFEPLLHKFFLFFNTIYIVEYRGYGCAQPQSTVSPDDLVQDVQQVLDMFKQKNKTIQVLLGYSIGGGVIAQVLKHMKAPEILKNIDQVIILNSFASISQLVDEHVPFLSYPIKKLMQCRWDSASALQRVLQDNPHMSLLWVYTKDDRLICSKHTKTMRRVLRSLSNIKFVELPNGNHSAAVFMHSKMWTGKIVKPAKVTHEPREK
jgi:pimeloyl-ACP methyl ester carboxylesterase